MLQLSVFIPVAWVACVHLAALGAGRPLYSRWVHARGAARGDAIDTALSVMLGLAVLANAALALAAFGVLHAPLVAGATLALAGVSGARIVRARIAAARIARGEASLAPAPAPRPALARLSERAPLLLALLFAACYLPNALMPVLEHDDNVYHLAIPRIYLEEHALTRMPSSLFANMPHIVEVLYTIPMSCGDFVAPKVFAYSMALWTLAALVAFARPILGGFGAGLIALVFVSGKNVQWHLGLAYVEPVIGFFLLSACLAFWRWRQTREAGLLRVVGVACGMAIASKYSAWGFAGAILGVSAFAAIRARSRGVFALVLIPIAFAAPWLVKNALYTGNPIYPNLFGLFGGAYWSEIQAMHLLRSMDFAGGPEKTLASFAALPWRLVTRDEFFFAPCTSMSLMALFVVAFAMPSNWRSPQVEMLAIAAVGFASWALTVQQGRFLVAWVPVMALVAVFALAPLVRGGGAWVRAALFVAVAAVGAYQLVAQLYPFAPRIEVFSVPRDELIPKNGNFALCEFLNREVPEGGKVLALWDNRFFFLRREFEAESAYEAPTGLARLRERGSARGFAEDLAADGFTHVVMNNAVASTYMNNAVGVDLLDDALYPASRLEKDRALLSEFVSDHLEPLVQFGNLFAFRIRAAGPAAR
ncbi:MAG: ArnT family glycosyltransferase [bacterium]